jgi:hypothetical protein
MKFKWHGDIPDTVLEIEHLVRQDMIHMDEDLEGKRGNLIFHTVLIGDNWDAGPIVHVWGEPGDDEQYHCEYDGDPKWESIEIGDEETTKAFFARLDQAKQETPDE